jgi:hemolysin activation/secretion protein
LPFLTTVNDKQLSGYGIGLSGNIDAFDWRFSWARRGGVAATAEPDKAQRLWLQGS